MNWDGVDFKVIAVAAAAAMVVAGAGGALTDIGPWYKALRQPKWKPPDWAFGPIWTLIFIASATAGVMAWERAPSDAHRRCIIAAFTLNGTLNILWSWLYFRLKRPDWSLWEWIPLWLSIAALIVIFWPYSPRSSYLLLPYLVWVWIAGYLNCTTVRLNGPFGRQAPGAQA
ncbi:MAG: tryptophan-rich sensory protein [Pseudorhodobacter sp.]|nr:tryptophan-rich sensory protein [Rhizobacter sp.]